MLSRTDQFGHDRLDLCQGLPLAVGLAKLIFETLAVMTIFVFRWKMPDAPRPYKCPGFPIVPALYFLLPVYMVINTVAVEKTRFEAISALIFTALSAMFYAVFLDKPGVATASVPSKPE